MRPASLGIHSDSIMECKRQQYRNILCYYHEHRLSSYNRTPSYSAPSYCRTGSYTNNYVGSGPIIGSRPTVGPYPIGPDPIIGHGPRYIIHLSHILTFQRKVSFFLPRLHSLLFDDCFRILYFSGVHSQASTPCLEIRMVITLGRAAYGHIDVKAIRALQTKV